MPQTIRRATEKNPEIIKRTQTNDAQQVQVKALEGIIEGYPIVFNQRTKIGEFFYEEIDSHALDNADLSDIKFMVNHDDGMIPLARHRRGKRSTMDINIDEKGLHIITRLDIEKNEKARALCSAVERGDIEDMSFIFRLEVAGDEWFDLDKPIPIRRVTKISKVFEVCAANDGAYTQTSIYARSATLENDKKTLDSVLAVALENEKRAEKNAQAALRLEIEKFLFLEEQKQW